jgi:hypothetical protein
MVCKRGTRCESTLAVGEWRPGQNMQGGQALGWVTVTLRSLMLRTRPAELLHANLQCHIHLRSELRTDSDWTTRVAATLQQKTRTSPTCLSLARPLVTC